jgi:hypothetical protein
VIKAITDKAYKPDPMGSKVPAIYGMSADELMPST